ncbi:MAG TPA: hypothetical protein PKC09_07855 [Paracoccus sp. (in: a-proteobacteria)]|uniref:hypothetical protein n=1 Tax=uncultured Paracoccus sp. TaxID=189685 RepID=UPI00263133C8|nr:hypothetical protein [uncultured Paracoccus sp.]HMQ41173.1 hypothetical protein [Paracoccus sp. (in: a-proteobacteria)]HMR34769.1 hypothetical protein [Paracoccus sp. (in: a-proteobacteria)]
MNEQMVTGASARGGDFALGFQPDGVLLLHRHGSAWAELGKAVFDNGLRDGLGQFIRQLRAANAPGVELVIPEEQILYTDLVLPPGGDTRAAVLAGLDGLTPYRVDELAFDYAPADAAPGATVRIAAVTRQTLQEAEDFAVRHGFAPSRFVAAPSDGRFPCAPDFGATGLAAEWELASAELTELADTQPKGAELSAPIADLPAAEPLAGVMPARLPVLAAPILSRITPHVLADAPARVVAPPPPPTVRAEPVVGSVNLGSIILRGEEPIGTGMDNAAATVPDPVTEIAAPPDARPKAAEARPKKPLPERARLFHERAAEARKARPTAAANPRPPVKAGRRSGLGGALPLIGLLVLGLGISAVVIGQDPAPVEAPAPQVAAPAAEATVAAVAEAVAPQQEMPVAVPPAELAPLAETAIVAPGGPAETTPPPAEMQVPAPAAVATAAQSLTAVSTPAETGPAAVSDITAPTEAAIAAAVAAAYATAPPPVLEPAPQPEASANVPDPVAPSAATARAAPAVAPAVTGAARPPARPQNIARRAIQPASASASASVAPRREAAQPAPSAVRPTSRPAASSPAPTVSGANPGAPASATLVRSARPRTAPSRNAPVAASPDPRPAVPRSPQPFERRAQPEPTGTRPPPKPGTQSSADGAALQLQPALRQFEARKFASRELPPQQLALFSIRERNAMIAHMDRPWDGLATPQAPVLVRLAEVRPVRRPTASDASASAVDAAVSEAIGGNRPAARAATAAAPAAVQAAPSSASRSASLKSSARPARRAGTSQATDAAVEQAIAAAVSNSSAVPGKVALLPLTSSARPAWRGNRGGGGASATASAAGAGTGSEGTLAPEPAQNAGQSKAEAEAAALAERRKLDDELQRQAEQRVRERAASDARAAAQAKAAAEARARAQAEAEAAAAARKNQTYRPPEVDNEPEVASAESAPTSGSVANSATAKGIDLNATQLIGTVGAGKASRGLIRLRNGRIVTVRLGDKINGGQISSIGDGGLKYVKAGREYSLPILNGR